MIIIRVTPSSGMKCEGLIPALKIQEKILSVLCCETTHKGKKAISFRISVSNGPI